MTTHLGSPARRLAPPPRPTAHRPRRRHWLRRALALPLVLLLVAGLSYARALAAPGNATFTARTADWVREHGGAGAVNTLENWWYTRTPPQDRAPTGAALPHAAQSAPMTAAEGTAPPALALLVGRPGLPGEGMWVAGRRDARGAAAIETTFIRPDAAHASVVAGVAWIRADDAVAHLVPGLREPGGSWSTGGHVPAAAVPALLATFNSGWKLQDLPGGFYLDGRTVGTLRDGQASAVITDDGTLTVGQWGRDVGMTPQVVAVRQNLDLVVDGGRPAPGLDRNGRHAWGTSKNQHQFTWRSGLGIDGRGDLIYVAGDQLDLTSLAVAMVQAGVVRGMELDMHSGMTSFASWLPTGTAPGATPTKLLPTSPPAADRYLRPDQRDFFYLSLR